MLSFDYCHFEIAKSTDQEVNNIEINEMRKDCMRLADEAIRQYKMAKIMAEKRQGAQFEKDSFEQRAKQIMRKPEGERTVNEIAHLKQYQDEEWQSQFEFNYDYHDDLDEFLKQWK